MVGELDRQSYDEGYSHGYHEGFDDGYDRGYRRAKMQFEIVEDFHGKAVQYE